MATKTPSTPPRRGLLIVGAAAVAVVVAIALIVASQLSADDEDTGADRAAAVTAAATTADSGAATTSAAATTASSTLPYVEDVQALLADVPQDGTILGAADAPVTVTEYADLRCPVCRLWETQEFDALLEQAIKPGVAKVDLQVVSILGPDSDRAAVGAWAAEAQGRLWPFAMLWFYNQGQESEDYATDDYQRAIAAGAGLDLTQFDSDRADPATTAKVEAAYAGAQSAGFTGTPSFVVSGPGGTYPFVDGQVPTAQTILDAVENAKG